MNKGKSKTQQLIAKYSNVDLFDLSDEQLLAYLLDLFDEQADVEVDRLIQDCGTLFGVLNMPESALKEYGISERAAFHLSCLYEIDKRIRVPKQLLCKNIHLVENYKKYFVETMYYNTVEEMRIVMLDCDKKFICSRMLNKGFIGQVWIEMRKMVYESTHNSASYVILCHNHNIDDLKPSEADINLTLSATKEFFNMDIILLDHVIVYNDKAFSMKHQGYGHLFVEDGSLSNKKLEY